MGKRPEDIAESEILDVLKRLDWKPTVLDLSGDSEQPPEP